MTSRHLSSWVAVSVVAFTGVVHTALIWNQDVDWELRPLVPILPAVLARRYPFVAGLLVWLITVPTFYVADELQPISLLLAAMWVVYTSARYGRTFTVVLSGLSIVAGTAAFLLWVSRTGIANSLRPYIMDVDS